MASETYLMEPSYGFAPRPIYASSNTATTTPSALSSVGPSYTASPIVFGSAGLNSKPVYSPTAFHSGRTSRTSQATMYSQRPASNGSHPTSRSPLYQRSTPSIASASISSPLTPRTVMSNYRSGPSGPCHAFVARPLLGFASAILRSPTTPLQAGPRSAHFSAASSYRQLSSPLVDSATMIESDSYPTSRATIKPQPFRAMVLRGQPCLAPIASHLDVETPLESPIPFCCDHLAYPPQRPVIALGEDRPLYPAYQQAPYEAAADDMCMGSIANPPPCYHPTCGNATGDLSFEEAFNNDDDAEVLGMTADGELLFACPSRRNATHTTFLTAPGPCALNASICSNTALVRPVPRPSHTTPQRTDDACQIESILHDCTPPTQNVGKTLFTTPAAVYGTSADCSSVSKLVTGPTDRVVPNDGGSPSFWYQRLSIGCYAPQAVTEVNDEDYSSFGVEHIDLESQGDYTNVPFMDEEDEALLLQNTMVGRSASPLMSESDDAYLAASHSASEAFAYAAPPPPSPKVSFVSAFAPPPPLRAGGSVLGEYELSDALHAAAVSVASSTVTDEEADKGEDDDNSATEPEPIHINTAFRRPSTLPPIVCNHPQLRQPTAQELTLEAIRFRELCIAFDDKENNPNAHEVVAELRKIVEARDRRAQDRLDLDLLRRRWHLH